jgi:hypothetical protein
MTRQLKQTLLALIPALIVGSVVWAQSVGPSGGSGVTLDTAQTITGNKTFSGTVASSAGLGRDGAGSVQGLSFSGAATILRGSIVYIQETSGNSTYQSCSSAECRTGSATYLATGKTSAGAPTAADCDNDAEIGRMAVDTTNERLYVCNGATRGWDYAALTD